MGGWPTRVSSAISISQTAHAVRIAASARSAAAMATEVRQVLGVRDAGEAPCQVVTELIDWRHSEVRVRVAELKVLERQLDELRTRAARRS